MPTQRPKRDLWAEALKALNSTKQKPIIEFTEVEGLKVLTEVRDNVEKSRALQKNRFFQFTNHRGDVVYLGDIADKIVTWVDKFVAIGDILSQYDPVHAALPWAALRLVLQVRIFSAKSHRISRGLLILSRFLLATDKLSPPWLME